MLSRRRVAAGVQLLALPSKRRQEVGDSLGPIRVLLRPRDGRRSRNPQTEQAEDQQASTHSLWRGAGRTSASAQPASQLPAACSVGCSEVLAQDVIDVVRDVVCLENQPPRQIAQETEGVPSDQSDRRHAVDAGRERNETRAGKQPGRRRRRGTTAAALPLKPGRDPSSCCTRAQVSARASRDRKGQRVDPRRDAGARSARSRN